MKRSIIYIDGFNLYYGALKGTNSKWLDLDKLFTYLRKDDDIQEIKYFTALLDGAKRFNQETYLLAIETFSKIKIILGKFKQTTIECINPLCDYTGNRLFNKPEEKRTDVNLAIHMLSDSILDRCDRLILVSGDSDLVPAINMIKDISPNKKVIVYIPARNPIRGAAVEIRSSADKHKTLPNNLLKKSQLPPHIPDSKGGFINKPLGW